MLKDATWWELGFQVVGFAATVLVMTWRVSAIVTRHGERSASEMKTHEVKDEASFREIDASIESMGEAIRHEFGSTVATLRSHMQTEQSKTVERLHHIENMLASDYISKDAFYATIKEFNDQQRLNFTEIKDWLKRFDEKVDALQRRRDN